MTHSELATWSPKMKHPFPRLLGLAGLAVSLGAQAHEGHGFLGPHWHATDAVGFAVVLVIVGAVMWWRGNR